MFCKLVGWGWHSFEQKNGFSLSINHFLLCFIMTLQIFLFHLSLGGD